MTETLTAWGYLLAYSVVNAAAFWLSIEGFRHADASIASLIGLTEVVFAVVFAAIVFHQAITWTVVTGGAFIVFAAMLPDLLAIIQGKRNEKPIEPVREL